MQRVGDSLLRFLEFHHHGNSFGLGTFSSALAPVDFKSLRKSRAKARPLQMQPRTRLQELVEAEELAAEGAGVGGPFYFFSGEPQPDSKTARD